MQSRQYIKRNQYQNNKNKNNLSINEAIDKNDIKTTRADKYLFKAQLVGKVLFHYLDFVSDINTVTETYNVYAQSNDTQQKIVYMQQVLLCVAFIMFDRVITFKFLESILKEKKDKKATRKAILLTVFFLDYFFLSTLDEVDTIPQKLIQKEIIELFCENFILCMQNQILIQRGILEGQKVGILIYIGFVTSVFSICAVLFKAYMSRYRQQSVLLYKFEVPFEILNYETQTFIVDIYKPQIMKQNSPLMNDHPQLFRKSLNPYFLDIEIPFYKKIFLILILLNSVLVQIVLVVLSTMTVWPYYAQNASIVCLASYIPQIYKFLQIKFLKLNSKQEKAKEIFQVIITIPYLAVISMLQVICPIKVETILGIPEIFETHVLNPISSWYNDLARLFVWLQMVVIIYLFMEKNQYFRGNTEILNSFEYARATNNDSILKKLFYFIVIMYFLAVLYSVIKAGYEIYAKKYNLRQKQIEKFEEYQKQQIKNKHPQQRQTYLNQMSYLISQKMSQVYIQDIENTKDQYKLSKHIQPEVESQRKIGFIQNLINQLPNKDKNINLNGQNYDQNSDKISINLDQNNQNSKFDKQQQNQQQFTQNKDNNIPVIGEQLSQVKYLDQKIYKNENFPNIRQQTYDTPKSNSKKVQKQNRRKIKQDKNSVFASQNLKQVLTSQNDKIEDSELEVSVDIVSPKTINYGEEKQIAQQIKDHKKLIQSNTIKIKNNQNNVQIDSPLNQYNSQDSHRPLFQKDLSAIILQKKSISQQNSNSDSDNNNVQIMPKDYQLQIQNQEINIIKTENSIQIIKTEQSD